MKKSNAITLGDALKSYVEAMKMTSKLQEVSLIGNWKNVVGNTIAAATKEIYIKDQKLFVKIDSSVIRNELLMVKDGLRDRLNEECKAEVIQEIVFR